ncbi:hypothetical protein [Shewanella sp. M-Br]|uniref:hypothetical protein n=1 Tax=Shewanella sp. M-Br TaxID=2495595 RepID=UPI00294A21DE|nr:hypothetical protein SMBr_41760 [Shewanella sp. M-Br]
MNRFNVVLLLWVVLMLPTIFNGGWFWTSVAIFYTGLIPLLFLVFWFSYSTVGQFVRKKLKLWHWAVIFSGILALYTFFSRQWASVFINKIFHVDSSELSITSDFVALFFTPFLIVYQEFVISFLWFLSTVILIFSSLYFVCVYVFWWHKFKRNYIVVFFYLLCFSIFIGVMSVFPYRVDVITKKIALWADFNTYHLCSDGWANKAESVLFLKSGRVLVYSPSFEHGRQFHVESCDYKKVF